MKQVNNISKDDIKKLKDEVERQRQKELRAEIKANMIGMITDKDNILRSIRAVNKGGVKYKPAAVRFLKFKYTNIAKLQMSIYNVKFIPDKYMLFYVNDNKSRLVEAPSYRDKIVQHMINFILREYYEPKFIYDSYACIRNKGNHAAVLRIQTFQRRALKNYNEPVLVKLDISKFFLFYR